jgi:putative SOS response-associated peptidase YedK
LSVTTGGPESAVWTCCAGALFPYWAKDLNVGFANINAKAEGIETRPAFRDAFQGRRCLVPVDSFYEWKKPGP